MRASTDAEARLWTCLRGSRLNSAKFRRQVPFGPYILDFYAHQARLVIEVDGDSHASSEQEAHDAERTRFLESHGLRVLRFTNHEVRYQLEAVLTSILEKLSLPPSLTATVE